jgi:hypothetical protein
MKSEPTAEETPFESLPNRFEADVQPTC